MLTVKTRKQGNAITVTIPKQFEVPAGMQLEPIKKENGILFRYVRMEKDDFDFDEYILRDIVAEGIMGEAIIQEFNLRKAKLSTNLARLIEESKSAPVMSEEEFRNEIGL